MRIEGNDLRLAAATAAQMQNSGVHQTIAPKPAQLHEAQKAKKQDTVQTLGGDSVSIRVELPKHTVDTLQKMGNISDFLNSVATNLRQSSEGLKATHAVVEQMKTTLDKVIKNYPPYPIESKGRMEELMGYAALQKQIVSMMTPPPPQPVYENVKHLWEDLFSNQGTSIKTPSLPLDAPNSHIQAAARQLDVISNQIGLAQEAMGSTIMRR